MPEDVKVPLRQVGSVGLTHYDGYVDEEYLPELRGDAGRKVYAEMESSDPTVSAIMYAILTTVQQVTWALNPADDSTEADEVAGFVEECRADMSNSWDEFVGEALSFLTFGWSYFEMLYKLREGEGDDPTRKSRYDDGKVGWRKFAYRSQDTLERWDIDADGGIRGMVQRISPTKVVTIPIEKSLLFRTWTRKNNPEGRSILRGAYRPWYLKKHIENVEAIGIERDLAGMPVVWLPTDYLLESADADKKRLVANMVETVKNVRRDKTEGLVLPLSYDAGGQPNFKFELMASGGSKQYDVDKVITRYDQRIAMTVLADFILLGQNAVGSYALADSKTALFALAVSYFLDRIQEVVNTYAIPRLLGLNAIPPELTPELTHGDIETRDILLVADFLSKLHAMGAPIAFDTTFMRFLFELAGLPEPPEVAEQPEPAVPEANGVDPTELEADEENDQATSITNEPRSFHLKGKHDQETHGRDGLSADETAALTNWVNGEPSAADRSLMVVVARRSSSRHEKLYRSESGDAGWSVGDIVSWSQNGASTTSVNVLDGKAAGAITLKWNDESAYVIRQPKTGYDVDYSITKPKMDVGAERETIVGGNYRVTAVKRVPHPGSSNATLTVYELDEYAQIATAEPFSFHLKEKHDQDTHGSGDGAARAFKDEAEGKQFLTDHYDKEEEPQP